MAGMPMNNIPMPMQPNQQMPMNNNGGFNQNGPPSDFGESSIKQIGCALM